MSRGEKVEINFFVSPVSQKKTKNHNGNFASMFNNSITKK